MDQELVECVGDTARRGRQLLVGRDRYAGEASKFPGGSDGDVAIAAGPVSIERMTKAHVAGVASQEWGSHLESTLVDSYGELRRFAAVVGPLELPPDDLVHDAIVAGLSRGGYEGVSNPVAYTKRTILNLASNERRRLGRRRSALRLLDGGRQVDESDVYPSDLEYLNELAPDARAVLFMHYVEGEPFEQIARELGKRASTVRQIATRARRRLREMGAEL